LPRAIKRDQATCPEADNWTNCGLKALAVEVEAVGEPRSIRDRLTAARRLEDVPRGYGVIDAHDRPFAYVYGVDGGARAVRTPVAQAA
jgi:hypothetical protein